MRGLYHPTAADALEPLGRWLLSCAKRLLLVVDDTQVGQLSQLVCYSPGEAPWYAPVRMQCVLTCSS